MKRVSFFIDGFNLYHSIDDNRSYHKYKWLNFRRLAECFISKKDKIEHIYYFTALADWSPKKIKRHKLLIRALKLNGVDVVYGKFRKVDKTCRICKKTYQTYEEKQTDVNIAIQLFRSAIQDEYDTAMIVSGDSDLIPSIEAVKTTFPEKQVGIIIPIGRRAELLKQTSDFHMKIKEKHLKSSIFEEVIQVDNNTQIVCPHTWK
jgi:uncharacterized LabA/DUF88 family protein